MLRKSEISVPITWLRLSNSGRLPACIGPDQARFPATRRSREIETIARKTNKSGPHPLWDGYEGHNRFGPTRRPNDVRTSYEVGNLYAHLVRSLKPTVLVEFGAAFGVSGMYFLSGIAEAGCGFLYSFEPNSEWANIAKKNMARISHLFQVTYGTFEDSVESVIEQDERIDLAFIDAIHERDFVMTQLEIVLARSSGQCVVMIDDIDFSDGMRSAWKDIAADARFANAVQIGNRVGVVELGRP